MKFPVRRLTLTAMLTCILFVQEELLMMIPNVQLTVLLIFLYGAVCGPGYGTVIVLIHVFLDNLVMGSMTPQVMIPMTIGWEITMLLGCFAEKIKAKLWLKCVLSALGSLIYCWVFVVVNILFLQVDPIVYITADIPFEVIIAVCSIVTVMFIYEPIYKLLYKQWNKLKEEAVDKEEIESNINNEL